MGSFCPKEQTYICFSLKISEGLCVMTLKGNPIFKGKPTCGLKNDIRNLANFRVSRQKFENLQFDWIFFPKAYKDLDKKIQKSFVS